MKKPFVALVLALGALSIAATAASANPRDPFAAGDDPVAHWRRPIPRATSSRLHTSAVSETTWVGYNPDYASHTNSRGELTTGPRRHAEPSAAPAANNRGAILTGTSDPWRLAPGLVADARPLHQQHRSQHE
jgi:hypothetical protein